MTIDWANFTPYSALAGGAILGIAAAIFWLWNGRIAGISGILGCLLPPETGDVFWRIAFIAGLIASPLIYSLFTELPVIQIDTDIPVLILAGLLVGVGTRYGASCTRGHGVCGSPSIGLGSEYECIFLFAGWADFWFGPDSCRYG